jgi:hypothetical protein
MRRMPAIQAGNRQLTGSFEGWPTLTSGDPTRFEAFRPF